MDADFDTEFEALLDSAATHAGVRTAQLDDILDELVIRATASRKGSARRWSRRRTGFVAAGLVAAAGSGVGAAAATGVFSPSPKTASWFTEDGVVHVAIVLGSGKTCDVTVAPVPSESNSTEMGQWDTTLSAAHAFMKQVDPSSISVADAVRAYRAAAGGTRSSAAASAKASDAVKVRAVAAALNGRLHAALAAQGLPADAITVATLESCRSAGR
jgi:hypothetical protein